MYSTSRTTSNENYRIELINSREGTDRFPTLLPSYFTNSEEERRKKEVMGPKQVLCVTYNRDYGYDRDTEVTWRSPNPHFTACFEKTVLTWFPCLFLWLFLPLEVYNLRHADSYDVHFNLLNVTKLVSIVILAISTLAENIYYIFFDEKTIPVDVYSSALRYFTFTLFFLLTYANIKRGVRSSGILFVFSFLLALFGAAQFRTELGSKSNPFYSTSSSLGVNEVENHEKVDFISCIVCYPLILLVLLLNCFADGRSDKTHHSTEKPDLIKQNVCPERHSSCLSRIFFAWFDELVWKGYRKPLTDEDLWTQEYDKQSAQIVEKFQSKRSPRPKQLKKNVAANTTVQYESQKLLENGIDNEAVIISSESDKVVNERTIIVSLCTTFASRLIVGVVLKVIVDCLTFVSPLILKEIIKFVEHKDEYVWHGYLYAISLFAVTTVQTLVSAHFLYTMFYTGLLIRKTLVSVIYRKALQISNNARRDFTAGEIINLMATDATRVAELMNSINVLWSAPLQICLAVYFLWNILGPSVLAGLAVMIFLIPVNGCITNKMKTQQIRQMTFKDKRVKLMNDILSGMKILKLYAWEPSFEKQIGRIRDEEVESLRSTAYLISYTSFLWSCAPFLVSSVTFTVYVLSSEENVLNAQTAFVALTLFNILRYPLSQLPTLITSIVQTTVSVKRINKFLSSEELDPQAVSHEELPESITIENGQFSWGEYEDLPTLRNINVKVKPGTLVAIIGPVGSGKSSLLSALLGEMHKQSGFVNTTGRLAYVPQLAWLRNATLKDNITFGETSKHSLYKKVLEACALNADLKLLPGGDRTEIGEKGINLSGGQKQRISLARAVFSDADVYLLDDPLSAVDAHVGKHIFERVIGPTGLLKNKTRVLVTHSVAYLPQVDFIIALQNGAISELGTYNELMERKGDIAEFFTNYVKEERSDPNDEIGSSRSRTESISALSLSRHRSVSESESGRRESEVVGQTTLVEIEEMETGNVGWKVYAEYLSAVGPFLVTMTILMNILFQAFSMGSNYWLSMWASDMSAAANGHQNIEKRNVYLTVYALLGLVQAVFIVFQNVALFSGALRASILLHSRLLKKVLRFPMSFYDKTPVGRILNRFGHDINVCDENLPRSQMHSLRHLSTLMTTIIIVIYSTPLVVFVIVPIAFVYYFVQRFYLATTTQLKRLESVARAPIYSHFGETVSGVHSIRAYGLQKKFIEMSDNKVDHSSKSCYAIMVSNRWLSVRLEIVGNVLIFFAALFAVLGRDTLTAGIVGLSISYALQITNTLNWVVRNSTEVETNIVAVERIKEYDDLEEEAPWKGAEENIPADWPEMGEIVFENVRARYGDSQELVLKGISFCVRGGEKVGIVGRTGAGKSSLTLNLFRIIESSGGRILIDDVDISGIGLHTLRGRLTIIPQDPVLFSGTLRVNLDPEEKYSDENIWKSLELAGLKTYVSSLDFGLQHEVIEGGDNFSVGQRQLICLARAVLRKTKILIMDEATAAVDLETDDLIQETIRNEFKDCTVLTIAHRLNTILDYDRIIVLDRGRVVEFDSPQALLKSKQTIFYGMAKDAGLV